jgi:predicted nucleic acid-binding protein
MHRDALATIDWLDANGHEGVLVPQVFYEYWVVATRPLENNGLGMDAAVADQAMLRWMSTFRLLLDERGVYNLWRDLVTSNHVKGKTAHDARLVAAMQRHGLTDLLTFNKADFVRFKGIRVYTPAEALSGMIPS